MQLIFIFIYHVFTVICKGKKKKKPKNYFLNILLYQALYFWKKVIVENRFKWRCYLHVDTTDDGATYVNK